MDEAEAPPAEIAPAPRARRRWHWRILKGIGLALGALVFMLLVGLWGIDTGPGHRLIADRIAQIRPDSGLRIRIGRIDGSIWRRAVLRDVRLYDLQGRFFEAPEIALDWHPLRWTRNLLDIDRLAAPLVILDRLPHLKPKPGAPILPGFDIHVGALRIDRLKLGAPVAGRPYVATVAAKAEIRGQRAMIGLNARSNAGDRVLLDLDALPDQDRFKLKAEIEGPKGGTVAGLIGVRHAVTLDVDGHGGWSAWDGAARAKMAGRNVADLKLGAHQGRYSLSGMLAPSSFLSGKLQRLSAPRIAIRGDGTLADRQLTGKLALDTAALRFAANGTIDLAESAFKGMKLDVRLLKPEALFPNMTGDLRLQAELNGLFRTAAYRYTLSSPHLQFDDTGFDLARATGEGHLMGVPFMLPVRFQAKRITGIGTVAGGIAANATAVGVLRITGKELVGNDIIVNSDKLRGKFLLRIDFATGRYDVALTGALGRYLIPGLGIVDVTTRLTVLPGPNGVGTVVSGTGQAVVLRFDNTFLRMLAGGNPRIDTKLVRTPDGVFHFSNTVLTGPAVRITASGIRRRDGSFQIDGAGTQSTYGPFTLALDGMIDHPTIKVLLDHPVQALGLSKVGLDLDPVPDGFDFRASGGSVVGPFKAYGAIRTLPGQPTTIDVADLLVSGTHGRGLITALPAGLSGTLDLAGGGIAGTVQIAPQGTIQRIDPHVTFANATLAADTPIFVRRGRADGTILLDPAGIAIDGTLAGTTITRGQVSLARANAEAHLKGGAGRITGRVAGVGGRTFDVALAADVSPGHIALSGQGVVEGRPIKLEAPAVLTMSDDLWQLAPAKLDYAGGTATVSGAFARGYTNFDAAVDHMPLGLLDVFNPGLGLGGYASGKLTFRHVLGTAPSGRIDMAVRGMTRSGLVLSSTPVDLGLAAVLTANGAGARAVVVSGGKTIGRAQAKIGPLPPGDNIIGRLIDAPLFAQLRYAGPGDTLWRLIGVETIDLSGPISVSADISGTSSDPRIRGSVATEDGRIESATTGLIVTNIKAAGTFDGSRLNITSLAGRAGNGTISGSGALEFGAGKGLGMDFKFDARDAVLLNRDDIGATVTGPVTLRSNGRMGTIGGDIVVNKGRFKLGSAASAQVPQLGVKEVNRPDEGEDTTAPPLPWTLDIKARASSQLMVTGLGLESEWRADLTIKGLLSNPAIGGRVDLVRGSYEFAGRRFDLDRGMIRFTGEAPPDPVLDITALANLQGISATIHVTGTGTHPEISFSSTPALPEDELLSRLLFGTSITNLSAPEALQLAAAVASLRASSGGGGLNLDPINAVRKAVRLDRLRILPADVTTGQKTAIAAGKNIGRRTYVELVTDGAGYSATSVEFRITRWLSVLGTVTTIGRQSVNLKVSKDY